MAPIRQIQSELMVIGAGMAGMAAAFFAVRSGIPTIQVGAVGPIGFASGLLDLLGVHPVARGQRRADPWRAIARLVNDEPRHPYALLTQDQIRTALHTLMDFLGQAGLPYRTRKEHNATLVTSAGTVKNTYGVPAAMYGGVEALAGRKPTLLVDFQGLKGYSARQILQTLGSRWPRLRAVRIPFPDAEGELYAEHAARRLEAADYRDRLITAIQPHVKNAQAVGLPAMLGIYQTRAITAELGRALGAPVFEIPTMVPSVSGLRLSETFQSQLPRMGVQTYYQHKILDTQVTADGNFVFQVGDQEPVLQIHTRSAILASGRFFGKGLRADRTRIHETLFDLPVIQPNDRSLWHHKSLLDPAGHPINRSGLAVDLRFRPLDGRGEVIHERLHAVGSILAHQDWMRQKCGSGLSIATAYGAVMAVATR